MLFEGEYLNWKRNGKGKEYYNNGKLKFEGEYLNNKRWNGVIYNPKGLLIGMVIENGNGKGKEYYDGELLFEVEYINY